MKLRDFKRLDRIFVKLLQHYWRWSRGLTLGVRAFVLDSEERVLLVRHGYQPGWHFPGGGVEKRETVLTALHRELFEETGVEARGKPEYFGIYSNEASFPGDHVVVYLLREWQQTDIPAANYEIAEQGFFALDALPIGKEGPEAGEGASGANGASKAVRARVAEYLSAKERSEHW